MKKMHYLLSILAIIVAGLIAVSCTILNRPGETVPQTTPENRQTRFVPRTSPYPNRQNLTNQPNASPAPGLTQDNNRMNNDRDRNNTNITPMGTNMQDRAEKIANAAARQKEVQSASCVITGNTAMVGLQFNKQYKGKLTNAIKRQVEKRVRDTDERINRVVVTADPDLVSRIEEIFQEIGKGRPVSGFAEELREMINRINPK
jgi:YhcN/YlaJ family sporulation lipoprotein